MADAEQLRMLSKGVETWNSWRQEHAQVRVDLSEAELSDTHLEGVNLEHADLRGANLEMAHLQEAILKKAQLQKAKLWRAELHGADLEGADLTGAEGFAEEQVGNANLRNARLPSVAFEGLRLVEDTAKNLQTTQFTLLTACLYSWLTIITTTHARLLTNTTTSPLPLIGVQIAIVGFYYAAPFLLLGFYYYFHLYLQRLWEMLADLPATFPNGRPLDEKSYPRPLSGFVRSAVPFLQQRRLPFSTLPAFGVVLLAWGAVPITLFAFFWTYLPRRDWGGLVYLVVFVTVSWVWAATSLTRAVQTLRGNKPDLSSWAQGFIVTVSGLGALLVLTLFMNKLLNEPYKMQNRPGEDCLSFEYSWKEWQNVVKHVLLCPVVADFTRSDVSVKPANWQPQADNKKLETGTNESIKEQLKQFEKNLKRELGEVKGAPLRGRDLRYVRAPQAFLVNADLHDANLQNANLQAADLRRAALTAAQLPGAHLSWVLLDGADLRGAKLPGAWLQSASLNGAKLSRFTSCGEYCLAAVDLQGADLRNASLWGADLKGANLQKATLAEAALVAADLQGADLQEADLQSADLTNATLGQLRSLITAAPGCLRDFQCQEKITSVEGADLRDADLRDADLQGADLQGVQNLTGAQLCEVKTAYDAKLDPVLKTEVEKRCKNILEKPKEEKTSGISKTSR